jgi:RND superfamily putative drug exporter
MSTGSISRFVLKHKAIVIVAWLVIFVAGMVLTSAATGQLSENFDLPGTESADANGQILARYGNGAIADPVVPVVTLPEGTTVDTPGIREELAAVDAAIAGAGVPARIASWASTGDDAFVSDDRRTTFTLVFLPPQGESVAGLDAVAAAIAPLTVAGHPVELTGRPELMQAGTEGEQDASVLIETLIGALGALVVLLYVFGSALAILPLLIAAVSILSSFLVVGALASMMDINSVVQYLIAMIGLGIAIDYALLVVTRWREERDAGHANALAVQRAMETAGHAVVFSGTTVGIGLVAMIVLPVPFLRGIGIGGLVIPLASIAVTLTLLPVLLATIGPALDKVRLRRSSHHGAGWTRWTTWVVRRRWPVAIVTSAVMLVLVFAATQLSVGAPRPDALGGSGSAEAGLHALESSGIGAGVMSTFEIVPTGDADAVRETAATVDGVRGAVITGDADFPVIAVMPQGEGNAAEGRDLLEDVRDALAGSHETAIVGGSTAGSADFIDRVYGNIVWMVLAVAVVTYILLVRAFRSVILPAKALLLNIVSVAASYGVLVLVWQVGWVSDAIWGIPSTGTITEWVPIMVFAFLFGLSMDYEVFIMARMREEYDADPDTDRAVIRGLALTGRLVTCAALILFLAFVAMAGAPGTELKIMATGLAAGIIIDATLIRALLVPALVSLMGHWNWWLPRPLQRFAPAPTALTGD